MHAAAYLLSLLTRQQQLMGVTFFERHRSDWLVWEPGPWRAARSELLSNTLATQQPSGGPPLRPVGDDALCFELKRGELTEITVGRGTGNFVVINDLTVSREQFHLRWDSRVWMIRPAITPVALNGRLVSEAGAPLWDQAVITAGDVRLTYYRADGFPRRLAAGPNRPA